MTKKRVLLSPIDPVHDIGIKMVRNALAEAGHETFLLPPDLPAQEIVEQAIKKDVDFILLSRTLGYKIAEVLGEFVDLVEGAGLRPKVKLAIGGMAIKAEIAAELGFDAGFGPSSPVEEAVSFVEDRPFVKKKKQGKTEKGDLIRGRTYQYHHQAIKELLEEIAAETLVWAEPLTSPAVLRMQLMQEALIKKENDRVKINQEYIKLCSPQIQKYHQQNILPEGLRLLDEVERKKLEHFVEKSCSDEIPSAQHIKGQPLIFSQYGTGCPFMDIAHIKGAESWGADGVVHFDPSWGARWEGFLKGFLTHEENGSVITLANLKAIKKALQKTTLWQVRAHRGVNTPETVLLAGEAQADLTKINPVYGSLAGGTDPARLLFDSLTAMKLASHYQMPFDMPTNEELAGVPAFKAFAGMLIVTHLGLKLGAQPVLQPLFCYSPEMMLNGKMADNYMDFNAAKIMALRQIIDAPIWPGAPIGFLTHTEERVQSAVTTSLHAGLAASLGVEGISIATTDEAYSGGPITISARTDTLSGVKETFRFMGSGTFAPTVKAKEWATELVEQIYQTLQLVKKRGSFVQSLYDGILGSPADGAYPGRGGKNTVVKKNE